MKLPRDLDGNRVADRIAKIGFERSRQTGSHIVLKHSTSGETITIPAHRPLKVGTLRAILRDIEEITGLSLDTIVEAIQ